jgi:hypothetical protein
VGEFTDRRRLDGLTVFVGAEEVRRVIGCSRARAYELLREAAGRLPGEHGSLRVSKEVWEQFIRRKFHMSHSTIRRRPEPQAPVGSAALRGARSRGPGLRSRQPPAGADQGIPVTQPRLKTPPAAAGAATSEETP